MNVAVNQKVKTPLGDGLAQGFYTGHVTGVLVRLPINDLTRGQMAQSNCITPRAIISGLWVFDSSELK